MNQVLNHAEFYESAMALNGHDLVNEDAVLEKIAEKNNISFEQAKLAQVYYEQLQKDEMLSGNVWYDSEEDRKADAFKLAEAYQAHVQDTTKVAEARANRLLEKLAAAAEEWAVDAGIEDEYSPVELVKIAGLQAESALTYFTKVEELREKISSNIVEVPAPTIEVEGEDGVKVAEAMTPEQIKEAVMDMYSGTQARPEDLMVDQAKSHIGQGYAAGNPAAGSRTPEVHGANAGQLMSSLGIKDEGGQRQFMHGVLQHQASTGGNMADSIKAMSDSHIQNNTGLKGFARNNKALLGVGAAGAGLGAIMYMKGKRDDEARKKRLHHLRNQQLNEQQAAQQPQEGVAHV